MPAPDPAVEVEDVDAEPGPVAAGWHLAGRRAHGRYRRRRHRRRGRRREPREELREAGLTPLLVAATGGPIWPDRDLSAHRTLLTTRSVEFDAVVVAALLPPAPDARQSRDAKAGAGTPTAVDPRLTLLVDEAFRHGKGIGVVGDAERAAALGLADDEAGVAVGDVAVVATALVEGLSQHRAWNRFTPTR